MTAQTQTSRPADVAAMPMLAALGGTKHASDQPRSDTPRRFVAGAQQADRPRGHDTHEPTAVGSNTSRPAAIRAVSDNAPPGGTKLAGVHGALEAQTSNGASDQPADRRGASDAQNAHAVGLYEDHGQAATPDTKRINDWLLDPIQSRLRFIAEILSDIEAVRTANGNRLKFLTSDKTDKNGDRWGLALDDTDPAVALLSAIDTTLKRVETDVERQLTGVLRGSPVHPWIKDTTGVGEKQAARLLAVIGDPYINSTTGQPRTVSALWRYCGLHVADGVAPKRRRGAPEETNRWSSEGKKRAWLIAVKCNQQGDRSPYRKVYLARRAHTAVTHPDWTKGHSHSDALRVVAKEILKDLWRAARDYHQQNGGEPR